MKICSKCKAIKKLSDFYVNKVRVDGYHSACKECHKSDNKVRKNKNRQNPFFKEKELAYKKEYRARTVIERKEYMKVWHEKNAEQQAEYRAKYREKNLEYFKQYAQENKGAVNAKTRRRQVAKMQRMPLWLTENDHKVMWGFYEIAAMLSKHNNEPWEVDHKIPLQGKLVSGLHIPSNLQLLRRSENRCKNNRFGV